MPDQLAAAGVNDVRMFSSLDLRATDDLVERLSRADPDGLARRAIGVDTVVTFGKPCPGELVAEDAAEDAAFCRPDGTLNPPYWIPADAVTTGATGAGPFGPIEASVDLGTALSEARPAVVSRRDTTSLVVTVDAPSDGWLWVDRAWYPSWRTTVDGRDVAVARAMAGRLIPMTAGRHEIHEDFLPWDAVAGLLLGVVAIGLGVVWAVRAPTGKTAT